MAVRGELLRQLCRSFFLNIQKSYSCALLGELLDNLFTDAAGSSGYDDYAAPQAGVSGECCLAPDNGVRIIGHGEFSARLVGACNHSLVLLPKAFDAQVDGIAGSQINRRLLSKPYAGRRAGGNNVSGLEAHEAAEIADKVCDSEDHGPCVAALIAMTISLQPHVEVLRVGDFVGGDEPRTDGAEGIRALSLHPLASSLKLKSALGEIVDHAVSSHIGKRVFLGKILRLLSNHHAEFNLPVGFGRAARDDHVIVGAADSRGGLHKQDGLRRDCHARLSGVIGVVQADADKLSYIADTRAEAGCSGDKRKTGWIESTQPVERLGRQEFSRNVGENLRQITDRSVGVNYAGPFLSGLAV